MVIEAISEEVFKKAGHSIRPPSVEIGKDEVIISDFQLNGQTIKGTRLKWNGKEMWIWVDKNKIKTGTPKSNIIIGHILPNGIGWIIAENIIEKRRTKDDKNQ